MKNALDEKTARRVLKDLRRPLLRLHKTLLDAEQVGYEREHGRIQSGGELLQLVINDAWFAWLRPMSGLIVMIDEHLEADELRPPGEGAALVAQARTVAKPDPRFQGLIQGHPDVALAHRDVVRALEVPAPQN